MGSVDHWENPYRNAPVASPFAILKDFVLGEDQSMGLLGLKGLPRPVGRCFISMPE